MARTYKNSTVVSAKLTHPEVVDWLEENATGDVEILPGQTTPNCDFLFEDPQDAILFSLRWLHESNS